MTAMSNTTTRVQKYGCPSWFDLDEVAMDQLWRANRARNEMVEAERVADEERAALKERGDGTKEDGAAIRTALRASLKAIRKRHVEEGLHWATGNALLQGVEVTRDQVIKKRMAGKPAEFRFHRWTGEGRLALQLQRSSGQPPRSMDVLTGPRDSGAHRGARIELGEERSRGRRYATAHLRVTSNAHPDTPNHVVSVPIVMHRPLPDGADVCGIELVRRRVGPNHRVSVCISYKVEKEGLKRAGAAVGVSLTWRPDPESGDVQIAVVSGDLPPPSLALAQWIKRRPDGLWSINCPWHSIIDRLGHCDGIQSERDHLLNKIKQSVIDAWDEIDNEAFEVKSHPSQWRAAWRFAVLAGKWPTDHHLAGTLEEWRVRDKHLWTYESHQRDQIIARKRDAYRKIAAWIADAAKTVSVTDDDLSAIRGKWKGDEETSKAIQNASPGVFRAALEGAAGTRGASFIT